MFPLLVGSWPFGLIFGALAVTSGFSPLGAAAMSAFVFAGSAQFIAVGLVAAGVEAAVILLATFVVNLRHMLYAAPLAPHLSKTPTRWLLPLGFWLTDESFVVAARHFEETQDSANKRWYLLGTEIAMYTNWQVATWVGILAGQQIRDPQSWGLDFAMAVTFIGMLVPMLRDSPTLSAAVAAGATASRPCWFPGVRVICWPPLLRAWRCCSSGAPCSAFYKSSREPAVDKCDF